MQNDVEQKNQFPSLAWNLGNTFNRDVEHGLILREKGKWIIPDYQRPLVWTVEQKVKFLESVILQLPIGEYTLHKTPELTFEVIDGQQRWNAIFGFVDNEFPVFGLYYRDLNNLTRCGFLLSPFTEREVKGLTKEQCIDAYNRLAYGGTPHEPPVKKWKKIPAPTYRTTNS